MRNGLPVTSERPSAVRRIWPPPSPCDPSMVSIISPFYADQVAQRMHHLSHRDRWVGFKYPAIPVQEIARQVLSKDLSLLYPLSYGPTREPPGFEPGTYES